MTAKPLTIGFAPGPRYWAGEEPTPSEGSLSQGNGELRRFGWLMIYGCLWAVVMVALEVPTVARDMPSAWWALMLAHMMCTWLPLGLMLAGAIYWSTIGAVRWGRLVFALLVAATFGIVPMLIVWYVEQQLYGSSAWEWMLGPTYPVVPLLVYTTWMLIAYGGLAAIIYALRRNIDLTTESLRGTAIARARNEATIADARFQAMVERIEPQFLLNVMDAARAQYRRRPEDAEATLNACVAFLRSAMPQLRSRASSVAAELGLAEDYLRLRNCMGPPWRPWHIDRVVHGACVDLAHIPLPPMALLPLLDRMVAAAVEPPRDDTLVITVVVDDATVEIRIRSPLGSGAEEIFDPDWLDALNLRLALVCDAGAHALVTIGEHGAQTLRISVPFEPAPIPVDHRLPRRAP